MSKTLTDLRSLTRYYALADSTSTSYSDADTLLNLNTRYQEAFLLATQNDGDWEFNGDGSQSISITAATRAYALATDLFKPSRVEIKYPSSSSTYQEATQITGNTMSFAKDEYTVSNMQPQFDLIGDKIEIFLGAKTANIEAVTNGIKVYYQKELTEMSVAGSEIIFPDVFARYIAIGAAIDYCGVNGLNTRLTWLEGEFQKQEMKLSEYVANRNKAKKMALRLRKEDYGQNNFDYGIGITDSRIN